MPLFMSKRRGSEREKGNENRETVKTSAPAENHTNPTHLITVMPDPSLSISPSQTGFRAQYIALVACWQTMEQTHPIYNLAHLLAPVVVLSDPSTASPTDSCHTAARTEPRHRNTRCSRRYRTGPYPRTAPSVHLAVQQQSSDLRCNQREAGAPVSRCPWVPVWPRVMLWHPLRVA